MPRVMGVGEILQEWTAWRTECVKRRVFYDPQPQEGEAAPAARPEARSCSTSTRPSPSSASTEEEAEVIPNLMIGFGIDEIAGRIRRRDQAAQHQQASISSSALQETDEPSNDEIDDLEDTLAKPARSPQDHHLGARGRPQEVRLSRARPRFIYGRRGRGVPRGGAGRGLPRDAVPLP